MRTSRDGHESLVLARNVDPVIVVLTIAQDAQKLGVVLKEAKSKRKPNWSNIEIMLSR